MKVKHGYYPGCSAEGTSREYKISFEKVYEKLGIELVEIKGWICCGASPAHSTSHLLTAALALKNLSIASEQGLEDIVVPCMSCYSSFKLGKYKLENGKLKGDIEKAAGVKYTENIKKIGVMHPLTDLNNHVDLIKEKLKMKVEGLKAVCYYGCLFTRPQEAAGVEDFEDPREMDNLLKAVGIDVLNWNSKTKCCGAAYSLTNPEISFELSNRILNDAKNAGSDVIVVACPLCQSNLDMRQKQIESKFNRKFNIPVIYITQLLGLALGASYDEVELDKEFVDAKNVLCEKFKI